MAASILQMAQPAKLDCSICERGFDDLRQLTCCSKSICPSCVRQIWSKTHNGAANRNNPMLCPYCRQAIANSEMEMLEKTVKKIGGKVRCDRCVEFKHTTEQFFCLQCMVTTCSLCVVLEGHNKVREN